MEWVSHLLGRFIQLKHHSGETETMRWLTSLFLILSTKKTLLLLHHLLLLCLLSERISSLSSSPCFLQLARSWLSRIMKYLLIYQFYRRIQPFEHVRSEIEHWLGASSYPGRDFNPPTHNGNNPQHVHLLYRLSPPKVLAITADEGRNSSIQPRWNKRQTILRETVSGREGEKKWSEGVQASGRFNF